MIEVYPTEKITYRRGNSYNNFFAPDFDAWQDYFCEEYKVEENRDVLVLHSCSWAKPYDLSYIVFRMEPISYPHQRMTMEKMRMEI